MLLAGFLHAGELAVIEFVLINVSPIVGGRVHRKTRSNGSVGSNDHIVLAGSTVPLGKVQLAIGILDDSGSIDQPLGNVSIAAAAVTVPAQPLQICAARTLGRPMEVIQSALEGVVPRDHIFGTELRYSLSGEIESLVRATAGYGKVARLEQLTEELGVPLDRVVYVGDGSSDIHVMLHVNRHDGFTIAVSESKHVAQIAKRTVVSDNALPTLVPILEDITEWSRPKIRQLFESYGCLVQGWESVQTDWLTLLPGGVVTERTATAEPI
jgi:hypothetical protein